MELRIFHGDLTPDNLAQAIISEFNRGNLKAQKLGKGNEVVVQLATRDFPTSGGQTALTLTLQKVADGVSVQMGKQAWLGLAASLGVTALSALRNPLSLLGRLDDIAQDIEHLQLSEKAWDVIEVAARRFGANHKLSERLRRLVCAYCDVANPVGDPTCLACGAPLGGVQPRACQHCGYVVTSVETTCPNCAKKI